MKTVVTFATAFELSLKALTNIRDNGRLHKTLNIIMMIGPLQLDYVTKFILWAIIKEYQKSKQFDQLNKMAKIETFDKEQRR